jgi:bifunctional N-acetylglucosamine-1-phosphate-uridyltransferase/glucosamine-1-phosphate-acetyltransferase GlmU-like protein
MDNIMQQSTTIIMAGGLGKRMNSSLPKVLHKIGEFPMIYYVVKQAIQLGSQNILIVVGKYKDIIQQTLESFFTPGQLEQIHYILQPEIKYDNGDEKVGGTGHAILCCLQFFSCLLKEIGKSLHPMTRKWCLRWISYCIWLV